MPKCLVERSVLIFAIREIGECKQGGNFLSGHSKWKNIAHRKGKQDASRAQLITKLCRDIYAAAKRGGGNADTNYALKMAIEKAKEASVPSDTIARTLGKATGTLEGMHFEEFLYEGYGPSGTAIMLEISSGNRNRTAAEMRHLFSKHGGSLGESGCVAWMFSRVGQVTLDVAMLQLNEEELLLAAIEAGANDVQTEEDECYVYCDPENLSEVEKSLVTQGLPVELAMLSYLPSSTVGVTGEDAETVASLLEQLEAHDDVQNLYTNAVLTEQQ